MATFLTPVTNAFQELGHFLTGGLFRNKQSDLDSSVTSILGEVSDNSRQQYLEDREHTEQREDTSYQRAVADMRKAGLNPYTVGSSPASSSTSTVGENSIQTKLSMLGYILDLKNLDIKNRQVTNQAIGNLLKAIKK